MEISKINLGELYRCYSTMAMKLDGELNLFFASEEKGYPCYAFSGDQFSERKIVWEKGGGTMSMIPIPNRNNEFLAIMDFYLKETPSVAKLVWFKYSKENGFTQKDLFYLPYLHRFDLYESNGDLYFIGATIAELKEHKEDWSYPGKIYGAKLPKDLNEKFELKVIKDGLTRNHGYCRSKTHIGGYCASDNGVFKITAPGKLNNDWLVEKILDGQFSEIAFSDINHDGVDEMITIEPFHGNNIKVYQLINNKYESIYTYPYELDFAHTIVGTTILGKNCFIGGIRRVNPDLFMISMEDGKIKTTIIDKGVGPANCNIYQDDHRILIHSSNHTENHAAVYIVKE